MPILNQRDYKTARVRLSQLETSLTPQSMIGDITDHLSSDVMTTRRHALKAELDRLIKEIAEYEALLGNAHDPNLELDAEDLGYVPILARIARKLSQRELADLLELKEQQIQRYEAERYSGISLSRYSKILQVLGVELHPRLRKMSPKESKADIFDFEQLDPDLLREIHKRNWLQLPPDTPKSEIADQLQEFINSSLKHASGKLLYRKTARSHSESETPLAMWRARAVHLAANQRTSIKGRFNLADTSWLKSLISLSVFPDGPIRAVQLLRDRGIVLVVEAQLAHTKLDGVALRLADGIPVIGLTLRHDRLDNFWFTLAHELGHIFLHYNSGLEQGFADDLEVEGDSKAEDEADSFATSLLIPSELWRSSPARFAKSFEVIVQFAKSLNIHPAIVVGRIQKERNNYKLFADDLGRGQIRKLFF